MAKKAIIYCRVATACQLSKSKSLDYQSDLCKRYALRKGYLVVNIIKERGSGIKINTGLLSAINKIKNGEANVLIATEPSRLVRAISLFSYIKSELDQKVELLSNGGCNNPAERELRDWLLAGISEFYQRQASKRAKKVAKEMCKEKSARS